MWDCLVALSTWAENNSGQMQIIIGLTAFWLAFLAYKKVLEQIRISQDQERLAAIQRNLDLKLNVLNLINQNIENNGKSLFEMSSVLNKLNEIHLKLVSNNDQDSQITLKNLNNLKNQKIQIEFNKNELVRISNTFVQINPSEDFDFDTRLNTLYGLLI